MRNLARRHLWKAVIGVTALLVCPTAAALPPLALTPDSGAVAAPPAAPLRPLPTLVPPPNDAIAAAEALPGLPFFAALDTTEATAAPDDPACGGSEASVWYRYTATLSVWLTADTFGAGYDTTLSVYTGSPGALVQIACNDDAGGPQSQVVFRASAGVEYWIMVAGKPGGGALELAVDVRPPLAPIGVRTTPDYEAVPAGGPNHVAWAEWPLRGGRGWTAYVKRSGQRETKVNFRHTQGFPGDIDGRRLVFQQLRTVRGNVTSDVLLYDLQSRARSRPPGLNTRMWEWSPTLSGDWYLLGRRDFRHRTDFVILHNRATKQTIVLDKVTRTTRTRWAEPGQVSGNYAVWHRCGFRCNVFLFDIAAGTTTMIANPLGRHHYDPAVTDDGTVYFVSSGLGCGVVVRIERVPLGGAATVLASLPPRFDSFDTSAFEHGDGRTSFLYERIHCGRGPWDIFKVVDP